MTFSDIVGHRRPGDLLRRAIAVGSLPQSLIFAGPDGIGKRLMAGAVAQALNCLEPVDASGPPRRDACGTCRSCRKIERRVHPDVRIVEPDEKDSIKIDAIRDFTSGLMFRPAEGRYRVVVIDRADLMEPAAQNALLKTLEEPPAQNVFVLVTSRPAELFETIRQFGKIPVADYHSLAYAVWSFDMVANQVLHTVFEEIAAGDEREPLPAQVAQAVLADSPESIRDRLQKYVDAGANEIILNLRPPFDRDLLRKFAEEIFPALR